MYGGAGNPGKTQDTGYNCNDEKRHSPSDQDLSPLLFYLQEIVGVLDSIYGLRQLRRPFFVLERVDGSGQRHRFSPFAWLIGLPL